MQKPISKILSDLMADRRVTQAELSRRSGVGQPTISRILKPSGPKGIKNPTDTQVKPIADFFGVTTDQLRGYSPIPDTLPGVRDNAAGYAPESATAISLMYADLEEVVTPRSRAILDRIISAASEGRLSDADIDLLDQIAARFESARDPKAKSGENNKKLRDRLNDDDTDARQ